MEREVILRLECVGQVVGRNSRRKHDRILHPLVVLRRIAFCVVVTPPYDVVAGGGVLQRKLLRAGFVRISVW